MDTSDSPFHFVAGVPHFRGLLVRRRTVRLPGRTFEVAELEDPAALLDQGEFARRFIEEDRAPYGLQLWPASIMLAEHILRGEPGEGRSAIELGCGLGLVSMAAAGAGWSVTATDNDATSLRFAEYNARQNRVVLTGLEHLDWCAPGTGGVYDRIFAADVLYQAGDHVPLLKCVADLLATDGTALIADPNRSVADGFERKATDHGFRVTVTAVDAPDVDGKRIGGRVFSLRGGV